MIIFKTIRWKNLLSTGSQFTEIDLTSSPTTLVIGTNGSGKSSILDALTFVLFGKPFRKINKPQLVNSVNEKDCLVEIEFSIGKKEFFVRRGIKPNIFEIYQNGSLLNQNANAVDQQKNLEQNILKLNYKSFTQIVVLGSSTFVPFMRLPLASRREIIEDLLDIQIFSGMNVLLKDRVKEIKDSIISSEGTVSVLKEKIDLQKKYILDIEQRKNEDITNKENKIQELQTEIDQYELVIEQTNKNIEELNTQISELDNPDVKLKEIHSIISKVNTKHEIVSSEKKFFSENTTCPTCTQSITDQFRKSKIKDSDDKISEYETQLDEIKKYQNDLNLQKSILTNLSQEILEHSRCISETTTSIKHHNQQIKYLNQEIVNIEKNKVSIKEEAQKLMRDVKSLSVAEKDLEDNKRSKDLCAVASFLLKDSGIKTQIIKQYLPIMNKLINDYLQTLDFYASFTLNENFEEVIKSRYRDEFSYDSFSEGEKARIDISLLLTWRSIAKMKNSTNTNLLILDEIFDGSLDTVGSDELSFILRSFDENVNVFVISHRENMADKFKKVLRFEKHKNFSYMEEVESGT